MAIRFPDIFVPIYEMVSFSHIPYNIAMQCIKAQDKLLEKILSHGNFFTNLENTMFIDELKKWITEYNNSVDKLS